MNKDDIILNRMNKHINIHGAMKMSTQDNKKAQERLDRDKLQFFRKGGIIKKIPSGESGIHTAAKMKEQNLQSARARAQMAMETQVRRDKKK